MDFSARSGAMALTHSSLGHCCCGGGAGRSGGGDGVGAENEMSESSSLQIRGVVRNSHW